MKSSTVSLPPPKAARVLDQLRERIRYLNYSIRTEDAYVYWVRSFIRLLPLKSLHRCINIYAANPCNHRQTPRSHNHVIVVR